MEQRALGSVRAWQVVEGLETMVQEPGLELSFIP